MAATSTPYGLYPWETAGGAYRGSSREFPIGANNTLAIFAGDPVSVNAGVITAISATPTTTKGGATPVGVAVGFKYVKPDGTPAWANWLPAAATTAGYTQIFVEVQDDQNMRFKVQATATVALTSQGKNAALTNFNAGNTTIGGPSTVQLLASSINTTATLAVKIVDFVYSPISVPGDAFTDCICIWNAGVHNYANPTGA